MSSDVLSLANYKKATCADIAREEKAKKRKDEAD
jgi:hypothetical protein